VLFQHLDRTFSDDVLAEKRLSRVRYVLVDDGSTDDTARIIAEKIRNGSPALLIRLSRNFGHASAISADVSVPLDLGSLANGAHSVQAVLYDVAGNRSEIGRAHV